MVTTDGMRSVVVVIGGIGTLIERVEWPHQQKVKTGTFQLEL